MQFVVRWLGGAIERVIGTSKVESLCAAANIFVGQSESPLVIRPYLAGLTPAQLFTIMTVGMAGVAEGVSFVIPDLATLGWLLSPATLASPQMHLLSGATMLGAFFILTDPVTASTTNRGRLIFGALAGLLVWLIRSFGGYPDGVAFAVLLANITVPLIDYYI